MGWAFGSVECECHPLREAGYGVEARCDYPRCRALIDRGLGYACGERHATMEGKGCGHYFCSRHQNLGWRPHTFKTHVRTARKERREIACELSRFRHRLISAAAVRHRHKIWPYLPHVFERLRHGPGFDAKLAAVYYGERRSA